MLKKIMKHKPIIMLLIFVFLAQNAFADNENVIRKGANSFAIDPTTSEACTVTATERYERNFLFQQEYSTKQYNLITQNFEVGEGCFEGNSPAAVSLASRRIDVKTAEVSKNDIWSFSTKGVSGERYRNAIYKVIYPGCCGATDTAKYFSLYTGKLLGAANSKPLILSIPNTQKNRYLFIQDDNASEYLGREGKITIFYSDREQIKQQISINVDDNSLKYFYCSETFKFADKDGEQYDLWHKSDFEDVSVSINLECEPGQATITIPIIHDSLSVDNATIQGSLGIKLEKFP